MCVYDLGFGGFVVSHVTPATFGPHSNTERGVFAIELCLQECG